MRRWMLRGRATAATGCAAVAVVLAWAVWPLGESPAGEAGVITAAPRPGQEAEPVEPLDLAAFEAALWNPPPEPAEARGTKAEERPPLPPKLELIAIVRDSDAVGGEVLRAALYDSETDRLHIVASGERVGSATVSAIDERSVSLDAAGRTTRLPLRDDDRGGRR